MKKITVGLLVALLTSGLANAQEHPDATKELIAALSANQGSFWDKVIIAAVGPVVGSLLIGGLVSLIADYIQRHRLDAELREKLVVEMTQAASGLYFQTQRYWRATSPKSPVTLNLTAQQLAEIRESLDESYQACRVAGEAIEARLRILFEDGSVRIRRDAAGTPVKDAAGQTIYTTNVPWRLWHATMDLLTVRYFQLIGGDTPKLLEINAGEKHSLISVQSLSDPQTLLAAYRERLDEATRAVMKYPRK